MEPNELLSGPAMGALAILGLMIWLLQPCERTEPFVPRNPPIDVEECRARWESHQSAPTHAPYLVVGAGFLGSRIVEALLHRGETKVTVFDSDPRVRWSADPRVRFVCGDVRRAPEVHGACAGIETVYLTAASVRYMDELDFQWQRSYEVNVVGAQNVIEACVAQGVRYLVQTSTMMVNVAKTFDNAAPLTEDLPYVTRKNSTSHYATTKALGEKLVVSMRYASEHELWIPNQNEN